MSNSKKKACSSLALELEGTQNLHTTRNCGRLRFLENALVVSELVHSLASTGLQFIVATFFPLKKIRYT